MKCQLLWMAAIAVALGNACTGDDDDDHDDGHGNGDQHDAGHADPDEEVRCPDDIPEFFAGPTTGIEAIGENGEVMARLIGADRVPPRKFLNTWTVELMDADGSPLQDVEIVKACAFMPVHGHGLPPLKGIKALEEPGRFDLTQLNFTMRGPWEVQLAVSTGDEAEGTSRGTDCDPGTSGNDYLAFEICVLDE